MEVASTREVDAEGHAKVRGRDSRVWLEHDQKHVQRTDSMVQRSKEMDDIDRQIKQLEEEQQAIEEENRLRIADENEKARAKITVFRQKQRELLDQREEHSKAYNVDREEKLKLEAQKPAIVDAWRIKTNRRIDEMGEGANKRIDEVSEDVKRHDELHDEHRERITQHDLLHVELNEKQAQLDARVGQVEQMTTEHHETLQKVEAQGNWIQPTFIGLAVAVGIGGLLWFGSKVFGKKKGDDDEKEKGDKNGREHARAWKVAPEVSGEYGGMFSNNEDADSYSD